MKLSSLHVHCTFGFQAMGQKPPLDLGPTSGAEAPSFVAPTRLGGNACLHLKHCFDLKPRIDYHTITTQEQFTIIAKGARSTAR